MSEPTRDKAMDIMRGIAIIMVFIVHYGQTFGTPMITKFGQMGCQLFFFASGYVCCYSYQRCKDVRSFIKKRFLSIAPAFYLALTIIVIANNLYSTVHGVPFVGRGNTGLISVLCNYALIHGVMPFCYNNVFPGGWFIGTLFILYLLHPCIMKVMSGSKRKWLLTISVMCFGALIALTVNYLLTGTIYIKNDSFAYYLFCNQLCSYLLGILCFLVRNNLKTVKMRIVAYLAVIMPLLTVLVFYSSLELKYELIPPLMGFHAFFLFLFLGRLQLRGKMCRGLALLGTNSFYIYLVHMVVVWTAAEYLKNAFMKVCCNNINVALFAILFPCIILTFLLVICFKIILKQIMSLFSRTIS